MEFSKKNFWNNDQGFIWLLALVLLFLVLMQFRQVILTELILIRIVFFIFMIVAIGSSLLSSIGKKLGYAVSAALLLFGFGLSQTTSSALHIA